MENKYTLLLSTDIYYHDNINIPIYDLCEYLNNNNISGVEFCKLTVHDIGLIFNIITKSSVVDFITIYSAYIRLIEVLHIFGVTLEEIKNIIRSE